MGSGRGDMRVPERLGWVVGAMSHASEAEGWPVVCVAVVHSKWDRKWDLGWDRGPGCHRAKSGTE